MLNNLLKRFTKSVVRSVFTNVLQQCTKKWVTLLRSMLRKVYKLAVKNVLQCMTYCVVTNVL